jgi:hypothetical protein
VHDKGTYPPQAQKEYTMAALSGTKKKLYRVQKTVKNLQLILINMWMKCTRLYI